MGHHMKRTALVSHLRYLLVLVLLTSACASQKATSTPDKGRDAKSPHYLDTNPNRLVLQPLRPKSPADLNNRLYGLAHIVLPQVIFANPEQKVRQQFLGPSADKFLKAQWEALNTTKPPTYPTAEKVELAGGVEAALIEMPPPKGQAHAYFTLVAFTDSGIRYFTLEHSEFRGGGTVLGGWTVEDGPKHLNFGEGPKPEKKPFLQAVEKLLK